MKLIALLLLSLAFSGTKQACSAGCLKCDSSSNCIAADLSQGYVLSNNSAVKTSLTNCLILNPDGTCLTCNANYYLDSTAKCTAVPAASLITGCSYYATATTCALCGGNTYLNNNACAAVTATIANCAAYASATTCAACNNNYILALDLASCVSISSVANCSGYTYVTCSSCSSNYHLNRNNYLGANLAVDTAATRANLADYARDVIGNADFVGLDVCVSNDATNCTTFSVDTNTCTLCNANYFLDTAGVCNAYPGEPIPNCGVYTNATTCASCSAGYTLTNSTTCTIIPAANTINNCVTYNTASSSIVCVACNSANYLSNNTCVPRVNSLNLASCTEYVLNDDKCRTCAANFKLTTDGQKCNPFISNCAVHSDVDKNTTIQCTQCNNTYYLTAANGGTQSFCTLGAVSNCAQYNPNNNAQCSTCLNTYYLLNNVCTKHPDITNCSTYDNVTPGKCLTCNAANSVVASLGDVCVSVTPIANCATHNGSVAAVTCQTCKDGYYLNGNSTACLPINRNNCNAGNVNNCTTCAAGNVLNVNATACVAPYAFQTDQCQETSATNGNNKTVNNDVCNQCKQGAFPIDYSNHYVCMSTAETTVANSGTALPAAYATDCLKVDSSFSCVQCNPAIAKRYLLAAVAPSTQKTCVDTCANGYDRYTVDTTTFQINGYNVCRSAPVITGCDMSAPNLANNNLAAICLTCTTGNLPVITYAQANYSNASTNATAPSANDVAYTTYIPSPYARYPSVTSCQASAAVTIANAAPVAPATQANPIPNCDYYVVSPAGAPDMACARCQSGYAGNANTAAPIGYITSCQQINDCNANTRFANVPVPWNNVVSCHSCTTASNIPFLVYKSATGTTNDITFSSFGRYSDSFVETAGNTTNLSMKCRAVTPAPVANWAITASCGIGAVIINRSGNNDATTNPNPTIGNYCIACKPGYSATVSGALNTKTCSANAITGCIANGGTMFDGCSTCADNFVLEFIASPGANVSSISFQKCLSTTANASKLANCYAATADATTPANASVCAVCRTGYNLNKDNICEALQPYNCAANAFRVSTSSTFPNVEWSFALAGNSIGCNKCNNSNIAVLIAFNLGSTRPVCVPSTYVSTSVDPLVDSQFIQHCRNYDAQNLSLACVSCQTNYIIDTANLNCNLSNATTLPNCAIATNATPTVCAECSSGAFSLSAAGVCTAGSIGQCSIYNYTTVNGIFASAHDKQYCLRCNAGYYPAADGQSCLPAVVTNCAVNTSANVCNTCATGYIKIDNSGVANTADVCIPTPTVSNCGSYVNITTNTISCSTCATPASQIKVANTATINTTCLLFSVVTGCTAYSVGNLTGSAFACTACPATAYLANNRCVTRTTINNCTTYNATDDSCSVCATGFYLNAANNKSCIAYPAGIYRCATYSGASACTACRSGFYLANNTCTAVPAVITSCAAYSNATTCSACQSGFALSNNTCVTATAQNCATYNSPSACATCPSGYVLTTANNTTNCTALTKTGCATIDANSPNNCLSCNTGYYLSNGACVAATTIARCTVYASATTCSQCDVGYALSVDKASCITNARVAAYDDANCNNSQLVASPVCSRCGPGRYFVNGACTGTCSVTGCLACSPSANAVCYICNTGYYQDSTGKCNAIATDNTGGNASIFGVLSALMVVLAVMFK